MQIVSFNLRAKSRAVKHNSITYAEVYAIARFLAWLINLADIPWEEILVTRFSAGR